MPYRFERYRRLEPSRPLGDLDQGFRAEVHDPAWFLGRQWQLGEHDGEDAASPVKVLVTASQTPVDPHAGDLNLDPTVVPPEAVIESEPGDWWTPGRRARLGLAAAKAAADERITLPQDPGLLLAGLPPPYDGLNGSGLDGFALYRRRAQLGLPATVFSEVPPLDPADLWDPAELVYSATFTAGGASLRIPRHDGGDVDWFSASADKPVAPPGTPPRPFPVFPTRMSYPGAPHPRWWQIEDARADVGGFPPERSHLATMLLIDLVVSHSDDWFTFSIPTEAGTVLTLNQVEVHDSFGGRTGLGTPTDWSLFRVTGLAPTSILIWPTVANPLTGSAQDEVVLGVDEDANLLFAVELRADGLELAPEPPPPAPAGATSGEVVAMARARYAYRPSTTVPQHWHPYEISEDGDRRRFVQAALADLEARPPVPLLPPVSVLLSDPAAPPQGPRHQIEPSTVPTQGLRLERRWVLGRATDGSPVLWRQRRRLPLVAPPVSGLRFDVLEEVPTVRE